VPTITAKDLDSALKTGTFAPVYFFHGEEDFRKDAALQRLVAAAVDPAMRDFNCEVRRGAELDAESLESLLNTPPMMAERRLVALRDVGALKKEPRRTLDRYLQRPAPDTVLVLIAPAGAKPDKGLLDAAATLEFRPLNGDDLGKWVARYAKQELGATIAPAAVDLLLAAVGNDLQQLAAELDKLASYARGNSGGKGTGGADAAAIDEEAVSAVVGVRRGETLGDLLDAVARRDAAGAFGLVDHVLAQPKTSAVTVVLALGTQFLALAWGQAMRERGTSPGLLAKGYWDLLKEGGAYPGRPWGEAVNAWVAAVDGWNAASLDRALALLLEADLALKETRISSDEQVVGTLVLALCALPGR
jgi:DNA polymerase-3 subunit delta